jgi:hypothetical protein
MRKGFKKYRVEFKECAPVIVEGLNREFAIERAVSGAGGTFPRHMSYMTKIQKKKMIVSCKLCKSQY